MKNSFRFFILLIIIFILSGFIYLRSFEEKKIPVRFYLSNKTGFDLTQNELHFGAITPDHSSTRSIAINNSYNKKVNIFIKVSNEISQNIIASKSNFQLEPFESKVVSFTIFTTGLTEFREYNGEVIVVSKKAII